MLFIKTGAVRETLEETFFANVQNFFLVLLILVQLWYFLGFAVALKFMEKLLFQERFYLQGFQASQY